MDATVTYVHHNCFCLAAGAMALVFDYPAREHRREGADEVVRRLLAGREAYVFFSHSHADHCSPEVLELLDGAASATLVLSYDVPDMVPELDLPGAVVVEPGDDPAGGVPGEAVRAGALAVSALESNDLGVAFFINAGGLRIYYGGDLAEWLWPGTDEAGAAHVRGFFGRSLDAVRAFAPHVAFMDCDRRLPNLAGYERFARAVRPPVLVPTHDFGDPATMPADAALDGLPETRVMVYRAMGDAETFSF